MNKEDTEKRLLRYINATPELLSLLYDMDLMPEQLNRDTRDWHKMIVLAHWHESKATRMT